MSPRGTLASYSLVTLSIAFLLCPFESAFGQWSVPDELRASWNSFHQVLYSNICLSDNSNMNLRRVMRIACERLSTT